MAQPRAIGRVVVGKLWKRRERDRPAAQTARGANIPYACVNRGEAWFLDECSRTRHGCIIWWKPGHCCTFCGWIRGEDGQIYGVILDNNYPGRLELTERSQFLRLWNGFGGFALTVNFPPASPIPARAYEVIQ